MTGQERKMVRLAGLLAFVTNSHLSPTLDLYARVKGALRGAENFCLCLVN